MEVTYNGHEYIQLAVEIKLLCEDYRLCCIEAERKNERESIRKKLGLFCENMRGNLYVGQPALLLALLDAYEITRDEAMLQKVLDVVSKNLEQLEVSADSVKLLAYCYYYVEEEECLVRARKMLEELKQRGAMEEELTEVEKVLEELAGNF